jgi:nucleotide-binding universal stress UspA family protein
MAPVQEKIEPRKDTCEFPRTLPALSVKNVLFATDFSGTSEAAFPYAAAICRHFGSTLHTAHVFPEATLLLMSGGVDYVGMGTLYEDARNEANEKIEQMTALLEGIPHRSYVRHGQVWENLGSIIEENEIDLLVVGTHGRTGLGKLVLGSVAEGILRHAPCPVLTVGPMICGRAKLPLREEAGEKLASIELDIRQIVYATNFSPESLQAAPVAIKLAKEFGAKLTLMNVVEDYEHLSARPGPIENGAQLLKNLVPENADLRYEPETVLLFGDVANRILKAAEDREADLLVLGARPPEHMFGNTRLPWTTVHQVIAHAVCPVLTVRR